MEEVVQVTVRNEFHNHTKRVQHDAKQRDNVQLVSSPGQTTSKERTQRKLARYWDARETT
jgi:hypothetical protein